MHHRRLATLLAAGTMLVGLAMAGPAAASAPGVHSHPCKPNTVNIISGTNANDFLVGTACADNIYGYAGNDVLIGRAGKDVLRGGSGRDSLRGVDGVADVLRGGRGHDYCKGDQLDSFTSCERIVRVVVAPA
jgi:hypothetical protein